MAKVLSWRGTAVVAALVCAMASPLVAAPSFAAAPPGGRITFQTLGRSADTRYSGSGQPVTEFALGSNSIIQVSLVAPTASHATITAVVHPCVDPVVPGEATFILRPDENAATRKVLLDSVATCLTSSAPVHVIIDRLGTVLSSPSPSALQYVAITPTVVLESSVAAASITTLPAAAGVPVNAAGVVVLLDVSDAESSSGGYARGFDCGVPRLESLDVTYGTSRASGLAYVPYGPGGSACVFSYIGVTLKATVLGYFSNNGPNSSAIPPSFGFVGGNVTPPGLRAITPLRVLDTRNAIGRAGTTKVGAGKTVQLSFGSQVSSTTTSVVLNVTATAPDATGFVTVYPCDRSRPTTSNLNYSAGDTVPNLVVAKLATDRTVCLYTEAATHLLADLTGTFETEGGAKGKAVVPTRILDTRGTNGVAAMGKVEAGAVLTLQVAGRGGVPASGASAATVNVTAVEPIADGYLTVWPCDRPQPNASSLNFTAGDAVPNLVTTRLSATGTICIFTTATTHLLADVGMWFGSQETTGFKDLAPSRILDTRNAIGVTTSGKIPAYGVVHLQVTGHGGVPSSGVTAVAMNMTAVVPDADGFVTAWPCDQAMPEVSNLNLQQGQTIPNAVTVKVAADGTVCVFTNATTHLLADVAGYYTGDPDTGFVPTILG